MSLRGWPYTVSTLSIFYRFMYNCDVTHRTSEAGNGETGPSTLSSLVGNFPCMPQSPAFTHPLSDGVGAWDSVPGLAVSLLTRVSEPMLG